MARFLAYDIQWDTDVTDLEKFSRGVQITDIVTGTTPELPSYVMVWLPGFQVDTFTTDFDEPVMDKLSDDFGFCITDCKIAYIDDLTQTGDVDPEMV